MCGRNGKDEETTKKMNGKKAKRQARSTFYVCVMLLNCMRLVSGNILSVWNCVTNAINKSSCSSIGRWSDAAIPFNQPCTSINIIETRIMCGMALWCARDHSSIKIFPNRVKSHIRLVSSDKIMFMFKGCLISRFN